MDDEIQAHQPPPASQQITATNPSATSADDNNPFKLPDPARQPRFSRVAKVVSICLLLSLSLGPCSPLGLVSRYWQWEVANSRIKNGMTLAEVEAVLGPGVPGPSHPLWQSRERFVSGDKVYLWGNTSVPLLNGRQIRIGFTNGKVCDMRLIDPDEEPPHF